MIDLHMHTVFSDGIHTPEEMIEEALRRGLTRVGISDHSHAPSDPWGLPLEKRGTHPGGKTYPDITFDYVLHRGFAQADEPVLSPEVPLSDHRMVWLRLH